MLEARRTRLSRARIRRRLGASFLLLPSLALVMLDASLRGREVVSGGRLLPYAVATLLSAFAWASLLRAASRRRGFVPIVATAIAVLWAATAGLTQATAFGQFRAYADPFAMDLGVGLLGAVVDPMGAQLPQAIWATALAALLSVACVAIARSLGRAKVRESRLFLAAGMGALVVQFVALPSLNWPSQAGPPDVLFVGALGKAARVGPTPGPQKGKQTDWTIAQRHPPALPPLTRAAGDRERSVLLILTESVRADAVCSAPQPTCATTPATNALLPQRLPLLDMHASATFTAVSFASITSGLLGTATREEYLRAPLVWDYARAAGIHTAYWSAQHAAFAGAGKWLEGAAIDRHVHAQTIDRDAPQVPGADDRLLLRRASRELAAMGAPFLGVVHLASTHHPYVIDPARTPFLPMSKLSSAQSAEGLHNRYRNSVAMQDHAVASFIEAFRRTELGQRTVIVFVSDHGESFFEHGAGLHGSTMFEEELHIPAWIDAPPGLLRDEERAALEAVRDAPTMNVDLLPTVLELLGLWHDPALAPFRDRQHGRSLLSNEARAPRLVITTNCSSIWPCGMPLWVGLHGTRKWVERNGVGSCYDRGVDPSEAHPVEASVCSDIARGVSVEQARAAASR